MWNMKNFFPVATVYATRADFCRTFNQDMKRLFLLSLLLTAGQHSAEQCFISSLGDCMDLKPVFKEWTDSWTRRVVLQNAIRMSKPAMTDQDEASQSNLSSLSSELNPALRVVLQLKTFQRFVFVISVLEGYSDHECSLLLRSSKRDVVATKAAALRHLATSDGSKEVRKAGSYAQQQLAPMG